MFAAGMLSANTQTPKITLDLTRPGTPGSPMLYGMMTEDINHSYNGGFYTELIGNRIFKDNPNNPDGRSFVQADSATLKNVFN